MFGDWDQRTHRISWASGARIALAAVAVSALVGGCSSDDSGAPVSKRRCAAVQAEELSKIIESDMVLQKAEKGSTLCRFTNAEQTVDVQLSVDGPVEAGLAELLLTEPEPVKDLGDEAWFTTRNTPLGTRLVVRKKGALLTIDLGAPRLTAKNRKAIATAIGEAGVENLPRLAVKEPTGERGEAACERFAADEASVVLGGVPEVTPTSPPGSCELTVEAQDLSVLVSVLLESGATEGHLDAIAGGAPDAEKTTVGALPAYWIPATGGADSGGQLDVLDDTRLLQIAVLGVDLKEGEGLALATGIAQIATA